MSDNTLLHKIVRPAVRALAHTRVTPNHITTARLIAGFAAAALFAVGAHIYTEIGALIFVFAMLLDRADGELARQTGRSSSFGYWYDIVSDCLTGMATFICLGIGLATTMGPISYILGTLAALGIGTMFFLLYAKNVATIKSAQVGKTFSVDPDDALILVPVLVVCDLAFPMIATAAVVAPLLAIGLVILWVRGNREQL